MSVADVLAVDKQQWREICRVVWLCMAWYAISSSNGVVGKTLMNDFQYPVTVTMVQLLTNAMLSGPLFKAWGVRPLVAIPWRYYAVVIVPLALGKFLSSVFSHVSIWKVPVSFAHTVKGTMPLFTVILSRVIMGEKQSTWVYLSLIPIICGVVIATVTEISFDMIGLLSALLSTLGFSLQNIFSKKVLHDTGVHHLRLLHLLAKLALGMFFPIWLFYDFRLIINDSGVMHSTHLSYSMFLLALDGLLNFAQNIVAFSLLSMVTPLTYSVCNATKRISVIVVSLLLLRNPVTGTNIFGMMLAIVGVLGYNKAKYDANQQLRKQAILPTTLAADLRNPLIRNASGDFFSTPSFTMATNGEVQHQPVNGAPKYLPGYRYP